MVKLTAIPVGAATATSAEYLVEIEESVCRKYCINSTIQPSASVTFSVGTVKVLADTTIAPVTATVTIVSPSPNGCGCAHSQVVTETFELAFTSTTDNNVSVVATDGAIIAPSKIKCCKASGIKITKVITASIA